MGAHANRKVQSDAIQGALSHSTGNHGPRMLLGNNCAIVHLERELSTFFSRESCIVSSTGYMACCSVMSVLCDKSSIIFADSHCHASLMSGFKLCGAKVVYFKHNCAQSLSLNLNWYKYRTCNKVVVVESIYSMDGTLCDLPCIKALCTIHDAKLVIDEAHGLGTLGNSGKGIEEHYNMIGAADVIVGTFSKSLSNLGGYICGSKQFIQQCEYYSHSNVFTAGLSVYHACGAHSALNQITNDKIRKLKENTKLLRSELKNAGFNVCGSEHSPVVPVLLNYDVFRLLDIAHTMHTKGYAISPVLPPACSFHSPRFRITATCTQKSHDIKNFVRTLKSAYETSSSKMNNDVLSMYKYLHNLKVLKYSLNNWILTIWTRLLCVQPRVYTFFMKYMLTISQCHQFFIIFKIIKAYCTVTV